MTGNHRCQTCSCCSADNLGSNHFPARGRGRDDSGNKHHSPIRCSPLLGKSCCDLTLYLAKNLAPMWSDLGTSAPCHGPIHVGSGPRGKSGFTIAANVNSHDVRSGSEYAELTQADFRLQSSSLATQGSQFRSRDARHHPNTGQIRSVRNMGILVKSASGSAETARTNRALMPLMDGATGIL